MNEMEYGKVKKCVLCEKPAVATAVHILVCEEHYQEYVAEAEQYLDVRPFYTRLLDADYARNLATER